MIQTKAIVVLFLAGQVLSQSDKSQQSQIPDFDPQLLNYQLQQLAIQQYSGQQYARQQAQQSAQVPQYDAQSLQQYAQQQYDAQSAQHHGSAAQTPQLTQQDYDAARLLQTKLFEPYQGQFGAPQSPAQQYAAQQSAAEAAQQSAAAAAAAAPQPAPQQLSKQSLLGVAYSSAADASKTSFTGYGVKYSF